MGRDVFFVEHRRTRSNPGSALLRTRQLWELARPGLGALGSASAVIGDTRRRDAVLVLNKNALQRLDTGQIAALKRQGNTLVADPLDGAFGDDLLRSCDLLIAAAREQEKLFRRKYADIPTSYVAHHVDLRIGDVTPLADRFSMGYFGELTNAAFAGELEGRVTLVRTNTREAGETGWMRQLGKFNAHYNIRPVGEEGRLKPFTKGFIAAHCGSVLLLDDRNAEARNFLSDDYPYWVRATTAADVVAAIDAMADDFGGPRWQAALAQMQGVREASTNAVVAAQMTEALAPYLPGQPSRRTGIAALLRGVFGGVLGGQVKG
jgi:hypothetical protein